MAAPGGGVTALPLTLLAVFGLWRRGVSARLLRWASLALSAGLMASLGRAYLQLARDPVMAFRALGWHSTIVPTYIMARSLLVRKHRYVRIMSRASADEGMAETAHIYLAAKAQGQRLTSVYLCLGTVYTLSTWAVPLLISRGDRAPYDIWFPASAGPVTQYVFQSIGIELSTYMVIVCDMFFISLMLKMIADFKTLNMALTRLGPAEGPGNRGHLLGTVGAPRRADDGMELKLVALVRYHQDLLR
ncbi:uncharacterized protein LOC134543229 [Bacillus rossius redtenbacheri]|uniref:uncharacterized protein LOC134543229 n=1 Tax=Bacillus rossius redtenbacheri TaxID=93214 RepID=UPI002FDE4106